MMMLKEKWFIKNKSGDFLQIAKNNGIDPVLAQLIVNRGIHNNQELSGYLNPTTSNLNDPHKMKDLDKACRLIVEKIQDGKKIRIIGDYDVDGVMAVYILMTALSLCKAKVDYEIPDRVRDGYGLNIDIVKAAIEDGVDTILTCDNGIAAATQIAYAKEHGCTVIVTDHHDIPVNDGVPDADAVVNPKQEDCGYPFKGICGAVVAFKLAQALYELFGIEVSRIFELTEFAAIATVCDVMDLVDENRILVKLGLLSVSNTKNIGLRALINACGLEGAEISAYHFGFVIGPCINASGRLESAKLSLQLLTTQNAHEAERLSKELRDLNEERKNMTAKGLLQAIEIADHGDYAADKVLVIYVPGCHESLAGIIAGRLRERYNKPSIVLTDSEDGLKGSGRSIEEYNMFEELSNCREYMTKFGGHPMAAGLSLPKENLTRFRMALNEQTRLTEEDLFLKVSFDMVLPLEKISLTLISQLSRLEPFGKGNTKPLFVWKAVEVKGMRILGANQNVLKLQVKTPESSVYTAMLFQNHTVFMELLEEKYGSGTCDDLLSNRRSIWMDFVFSLNINAYNGTKTPQLVISNFR